jgi:hypothetical protein
MKKYTIALAAACALFLASCSNKPEEIVNDFYLANQSNDYEKALSYTDLPEEAQPQVIEYLESMGMVIHEYEILGTTIDEGDTTALVDLRLVTSNAFHPDSIFDQIKVPCVKDGRKWRVHLDY